jgi:hypothetical protein
MLEYQSGIIFLTTNRLSDFDTALFSRVHFSIKFEQLPPAHCRFIWTKMAEQTEHGLTDDDFDTLSQFALDGRTIKNVLRVASLHTQSRSKAREGASGKMNMIDVKAVFPYAVGASEGSDLARQMEAFCAS